MPKTRWRSSNTASGQKVAAGGAVALYTVMYQAAPVKVTVAPNVLAAFGPVMPNVVGMTFTQAYDAFKKAGLDFEKYRSRYTWKDDSTDPRCQQHCVVSQTPAPGTQIKPDTPTVLVLSAYWPMAIVPDIKNLTVDQAMQKVRAAGFGFESKPTETAWPELNGKVYGQSPAPGTKLRTGGATGSVVIQSYIYKESALEVKAQFMPEAKTYLLMVKGGAQPYDIAASYDVPKGIKTAPGQKVVTIINLADTGNAPGWKVYRIKYDPIKIEEAKARIFDNSAVVTGKFNLKVFARGKMIEGVNRFGLVIVKTKQGIQVASFQATAIPQPK